MQSTFIINAEVKGTVTDSDSDAYKIGNPHECGEEINQEITPLEKRDYLFVEQNIFQEPQPQRGNIKHLWLDI
jgi:hypothetical protein